MFRHVFLIACLVLVGVTAAHAGEIGPLKIISPASGIVVRPGQDIQIKVETIENDPEILAGGWVGLSSNLLKSDYDLKLAHSPYVFDVKIPEDARPGQYFVFGSVYSPDRNYYAQSQPVILNIVPTMVRSYEFENEVIWLEFVGDTREVSIIGVDEGGKQFFLPPVMAQTVKYSSGDESIARVSSDGRVSGMGQGSTDIRAEINGIQIQSQVKVNGSDIRGDIQVDGVVDGRDLQMIKAYIGRSTDIPNDARDLNQDGKIDAADVQALKMLCKNQDCAIK